jgi:hypothetical protein
MSNQAMLIFHRNLTIYLREKAFRMDFLFPIISAVILIIASTSIGYVRVKGNSNLVRVIRRISSFISHCSHKRGNYQPDL